MASHPLLRLSLLPSRPLKSPFLPPFPASQNRVGSVSSEAGPTHLRAQRRSIVLPGPPNNLAHTAATTRLRPPRRTLLTTCMSSSSTRDYNHTTPAVDRLVSAVAYVLPLLKGLSYGRFLFVKYPSLAEALEPVLPLLNLYHSIPYASLVSFFALYLGVARNPRFSRYVRFNAMQAVVLQVFLAFPLLLQQILSLARTGLGYKLMVMVYNTLFVFVVCCFVYSVVCCILGRTPYLPMVAEAADKQTEKVLLVYNIATGMPNAWEMFQRQHKSTSGVEKERLLRKAKLKTVSWNFPASKVEGLAYMQERAAGALCEGIALACIISLVRLINNLASFYSSSHPTFFLLAL